MTDDIIDTEISNIFHIQQKLGKGAYGIVWKAIHKQSHQTVAIKKCFDSFRNNVDAQRTYREVMYLRALSGHENIIQLHNIIRSDSDRDVYLIFDYMETDLYVVIRANILQGIHMQYITYQLLKALKYIHSARLIHRDIKPSNILINADCKIKLCDFGLCRSIDQDESVERKLTDYIATRWYRSPEILLGSTKYSTGMDMWSIACILGEMISGQPLLPGNSTMNQLERIIQLHGVPSQDEIRSMYSPFAEVMLADISIFKHEKLHVLCREASNSALDLIHNLMRFNPTMRLSAEKALDHPFVKDFHNHSKEPSFHGVINVEVKDNVKLSTEKYRDLLFSRCH